MRVHQRNQIKDERGVINNRNRNWMSDFMLRINVHQIIRKWNQCKDNEDALNNKCNNALSGFIEKII